MATTCSNYRLTRASRISARVDFSPWIVVGKVAGLGTKDYKLMLDPKEGKIRTWILAKRHLSIFLHRNYSNGDNTAVSLELRILLHKDTISLLGL